MTIDVDSGTYRKNWRVVNGSATGWRDSISNVCRFVFRFQSTTEIYVGSLFAGSEKWSILDFSI